MSEYKKFVQRIGLVGISNLLVAISNIILIPILTKTLLSSGYGIWIQITITITLITSFTSLGLPNAMLVFLSPIQDKEKIKEGFYTMLFSVFVFSIIISMLILVFSAYIADNLLDGNVVLTILLSFLVLFSSLNTILINYFRTFHEIKLYSFFLLVQTYLGVLLISYFALTGKGLVYVTFGLLVSYILILVIMLGIIINSLGFMIPQFIDIKKYLSFSVPTTPGNISYWVVNFSDRYIIGIFLGVSYVGYYSPGYTLASLITMIMFPFSLLLPAILPKYHENGEHNEMQIFLKYSMKYFLLLAIPCVVGLSLLSKPLLMILTTPEIAIQGYMVTPIVALSSLFFGAYGIVSNIIVLNKKTKIIGFIWVLVALINVGLTIFLIPFWGIIGAAVATLVAFLLAFLLTWWYSIKLFHFDFNLAFFPKIIIASSLMAIIIIIFNPLDLTNIILVTIISTIIYFTTLFLLKGILIDEINFLRELIKI